MEIEKTFILNNFFFLILSVAMIGNVQYSFPCNIIHHIVFLFSILNWVHIFYKAFVVKLLELFGPLSALLYCVAITVVILLKLSILQKGPFYQNQILNSFLLSWVICSLLWVLDLNLSVSKSPLDVQIDIALLQLSATCFWWLPGQTPALHHHLPPIFFKFISFLKMAISFLLISIYISSLLC